jgi:hypothetical protein
MSLKDDSGYFETSKLLSEKIARTKDGAFLHLTSCMDIGSRRTLAILEFIKDDEDEKGKEEIEEIEKFMKLMGMANWQRDVITDLGLKSGKPPKRHGSFKL